MNKKIGMTLNEYRLAMNTATSRLCSICKIDKPMSEFYKSKRSVNGLDTQCKPCKRLRVKESLAKNGRGKRLYKENRAAISAKRKAYKRNLKTKLISMLGGCCAHCSLAPSNEWPLACFDFHHMDHSVKGAEIGKLLDRQTKEGLEHTMNELKNCLVLCSNCHRREHSKIGFPGRVSRPDIK